jgi:hypothetical protein
MSFKNLKSGLNSDGEKLHLETENLILLPVTEEIENQKDVIRTMSRERNFYSTNFFSQTTVTEHSTLTYLRAGAISDDSRILFLIRDKQGMLVGQVGFKNLKGDSTELDAVSRDSVSPKRISIPTSDQIRVTRGSIGQQESNTAL